MRAVISAHILLTCILKYKVKLELVVHNISSLGAKTLDELHASNFGLQIL